MHTPPKFLLEFLPLSTHPLAHGLPKHDEPPLPVPVTYMRETQEIEGLRLAVATPFPIHRRTAAKFEQAGFRGMQFQIELSEPLLKFFEKLLGFMAILEADHKVIRKAHDHNITARSPTPPLISP